MEPFQSNSGTSKPRILLAACGSVAAVKFANLCHCFCEWAEVKAVASKASLHFIDKTALPKDLIVYTDEDEWSTWGKIGDSVLHIELRRWADIMVIAPLSANTLGKIAGGLCDNLLTCIVRAWDYSKPLFVAPAMTTFMWDNPFTERHLLLIDDLGINLIPPISKKLACGDYGNGAMAEPSLIFSTFVVQHEVFCAFNTSSLLKTQTRNPDSELRGLHGDYHIYMTLFSIAEVMLLPRPTETLRDVNATAVVVETEVGYLLDFRVQRRKSLQK